MADIVASLEKIRARFGQPGIQAAFRGFQKTLQFTFPDLRRTFTLSIAEDGSATLEERAVPHPDVQVTTSSATLNGIVDNTVNPIQAYLTRKLKVSGQMEDLLRLQKLL